MRTEKNSQNCEYQKQAIDFLTSTNTKMRITFLKNGFHLPEDVKNNTYRDIYRVKIYNKKHSFSFNFGNSLNDTKKRLMPNEYDILACLNKYDVGSLEDFCLEFGYNKKIAGKIYKACLNEYENICKLFTEDEIELLTEIR